jgi:circadian clock protein KaiB
MKGAPEYRFRLYVAGQAKNSRLAREQLDRICGERLAGRFRIEVIDVMTQPQWAFEDAILVTPTLIRVAPEPEVRIIGNLSERTKVEAVLGLEGGAP